MKDEKDKATGSLFGAGRPRVWTDDAEKMRHYRREKRIKKIMSAWHMTREQAERMIALGCRVRS